MRKPPAGPPDRHNLGFDRMSAERIILIVFPDDLPAIKCYRSTGFVQVSEEYHQFNGKGAEHRLLRFEITPTLA
jgi:ribosomal protein S18 acetylase RimI-like enzyme